MEDLYARFLPQFMLAARGRVATAVAAAGRRDHAANLTIIRELHTLAGEAGLLGLADLVPLARDCEHKTKLFDVSGDERDAAHLDAALRELARAIERLGATPAPDTK